MYQWRLVVEAMIIMLLLRRAVRAFSAQPLNHLRRAYKAGLNFLTLVCILLGDKRQITKTGFARPKFLNSVF